jgi:hypothetical protein
MSKVFISHHEEHELIRRLEHDLRAEGFAIVRDQNVDPGASWTQSVYDAIASSQFVVPVLSPRYFDSFWTRGELNIGLAREADHQCALIPILVRPCEVPQVMSQRPLVSFIEGYEVGRDALVHRLKNGAQRGAPDLQNKDASIQKEVDRFMGVTAPRALDDRVTMKPRCFVVMDFKRADLQIVYANYVFPALDGCGLSVQRGDDAYGGNAIIDDIESSIRDASIIVAELTGKNSNVYYEVGLAHAMGKTVILLTQSMDDVPFDLRHRRVVNYQYDHGSCKKLASDLAIHVSAALKGGSGK